MQQVVLHVLLVDGRRALLHPAGEQVGHQGAQGALDVHALVLVEAVILDGDDRVLHVLRDLLSRHRVAALIVEPRDGLAGDVVDGGHPRRPPVRHVREVGLHRFIGACDGSARDSRDRGHGQGAEDSRQDSGEDDLDGGAEILRIIHALHPTG